MLTKNDLITQIQALGIQPSDTVLIHTSLRSIGMVEGGADGLIDAFCDYLSDGLFLVPTHTWDNVTSDQPVYDVKRTMPCIGAVPCAAAFRTDGIRSLHPTHSIWAHGHSAAAYLQGEEAAETPTPVGGPWSRLADVGAKILLIGVGNNRNTFIHSIEELIQVPDRLSPEPFDVTIIDENGTQYHHPQFPHYCSKIFDVSRFFVNFDKPLTELGAQTFGTLGNATVRIVDAARCREILCRVFTRANDDLLLTYGDIPEEYYLP